MSRPTALIVAEPREMANAGEIWGTGGWLPPRERRALDWFTLCRLMGLRVLVTMRDEFRQDLAYDGVYWLIIACDPESIDLDLVSMLKAALQDNPLAVICQATAKGTPLADWIGTRLADDRASGQWISMPHPDGEQRWRCGSQLETMGVSPGDDATVTAILDQHPLIATTSIGRGRVIASGFDSSEMRDRDGVFSSLLQQLILCSSTDPVPFLNWRNTMVLRMDDPGSCETVYNQCYGLPKLGAEEWEGIGRELRARNGRMSLAYVSGWVDAGDGVPGTLEIAGKKTKRVPCAAYPSPTVRFECPKESGIVRFDHVEEYHCIQELRKAGLVEVELHGFTHLTPDRSRWAAATDQFENNSWFREFGPEAVRFIEQNPGIPHPVDEALELFEHFFSTMPTALISPGEEFTSHVLTKALDRGMMLVSSYYLAIRDHDRWCWTQHVCAPYLDGPDAKWFDSGLPVVGYFHDFDIVRNGVRWFTDCLDQWQRAGAEKFIDFRELNAALNIKLGMRRMESGWELSVCTDAAHPLPRAMEVKLFFPDGTVPAMISIMIDGRRSSSRVTYLGGCLGSIVIGDA